MSDNQGSLRLKFQSTGEEASVDMLGLMDMIASGGAAGDDMVMGQLLTGGQWKRLENMRIYGIAREGIGTSAPRSLGPSDQSALDAGRLSGPAAVILTIRMCALIIGGLVCLACLGSGFSDDNPFHYIAMFQSMIASVFLLLFVVAPSAVIVWGLLKEWEDVKWFAALWNLVCSGYFLLLFVALPGLAIVGFLYSIAEPLLLFTSPMFMKGSDQQASL